MALSIHRTNLYENEIKMSIFLKKNKPLATVLVVDERKAQHFGSQTEAFFYDLFNLSLDRDFFFYSEQVTQA